MASYRFEPMLGLIAKGAIVPLSTVAEWPAMANHVTAANAIVEAAREFRRDYPKDCMVLCSIETIDNVYTPKRPYLCTPAGTLIRPSADKPDFRYFKERLRTILDDSRGFTLVLTQLPSALRRSIGQIIVCGDALYIGDRSFMFTEGETKQSDTENLKAEICWSRIARLFTEQPSGHDLIAWETPLLARCEGLVERLEASS